MPSLTTDTDLKANGLYFKLTEKERQYVRTIPINKFRITLDQLNKDKINISNWIRYVSLAKDIVPHKLMSLLGDLEFTEKEWVDRAADILSKNKMTVIQKIMAPHRQWLDSLHDGIIDHNIRAISQDQLIDGITYNDLVETIREERKNRAQDPRGNQVHGYFGPDKTDSESQQTQGESFPEIVIV